MTIQQHPAHFSSDLLSLARAPMSERISALEAEWANPATTGLLPARAQQIAGLILAEAIRLIRLGTRAELTESALALAQLVVDAGPHDLADRQPEAYRLLSGATVALGAAGSPSSPGGELSVLRSWNGKAREVVAALSGVASKAMPRLELRTRLGISESHLSHLLADLEAAGLAVRIRDGRTATVHLGPIGRSEHVQRLVAPDRYSNWGPSGFERDLSSAVTDDAHTFPIHTSQTHVTPISMQHTGRILFFSESLNSALGDQSLLELSSKARPGDNRVLPECELPDTVVGSLVPRADEHLESADGWLVGNLLEFRSRDPR